MKLDLAAEQGVSSLGVTRCVSVFLLSLFSDSFSRYLLWSICYSFCCLSFCLFLFGLVFREVVWLIRLVLPKFSL
jgi:hypothetical protein